MDKLPPKPRKLRGVSREELLKLNKEELVDRLIQLEAHTSQLKNIIAKNQPESCVSEGGNKHQKKFDFGKSHFRPVLLHIVYLGWDYHGYVVQEDTAKTIEHHLFQALARTCFIESRETAQYHRCGRTDRGVSAYGQVISLHLRSKHPPETQNEPESIAEEFNYAKILNRILPKEIRVVGWIPAPPGYSARFDCKKRQYKYYFPRSSLDVQAMRQACVDLVGSHDFRNLCKMDVGNGVTEFRRRIVFADIVPVDKEDTDKPTSMYYFIIEGNAFLWHQIRCIMAVLLLVGSGQESSDVVERLLDVESNARKPQYNMAIDVPLNLFECNYELENTTKWVYDEENLAMVIMHLQGEWTVQNIKATMIKDCLRDLEQKYAELVREKGTEYVNDSVKEGDGIISYIDCLTQGVKPKNYTPLMKRVTCSSLEEKIEHYRKRRKIPRPEETATQNKSKEKE